MTSTRLLSLGRRINAIHSYPLRVSYRCISSLEVRRRAQKAKPIKRRKSIQSSLRELDEGESQILYSTDSALQEMDSEEKEIDDKEVKSTSKLQTKSKSSSSSSDSNLQTLSVHKLLPEIRRHIKPTGEYLYGPNAVLSALKANKRPFFHRLFMSPIADDTNITKQDEDRNIKQSKRVRNFADIMSLCESMDIPIEYCSKQELNHFVSKNMHQGVVLDCDPLIIPKLDEQPLDGHSGSIWIAFDHLFNEENVGAVLRSALFFGVDGCIFTSKHRAPLSPLVATTSSGALDGIDIRLCSHQPLHEYLESMKESGWRIIGLDIKGSGETEVDTQNIVELSEFQKSRDSKMIIVIGNESKGLGPSKNICTDLVYIGGNEGALYYNVDSLNVASACSIMLYQTSLQ